METSGASQFARNPALALSNTLGKASGGGLGGYLGQRAQLAFHERAAEVSAHHAMQVNEHSAGLQAGLADHSHGLAMQREAQNHEYTLARTDRSAQHDMLKAAQSHQYGSERDYRQHSYGMAASDAASGHRTAEMYAKAHADITVGDRAADRDIRVHDHTAPERQAARDHEVRMAKVKNKAQFRETSAARDHATSQKVMDIGSAHQMAANTNAAKESLAKTTGKQQRKLKKTPSGG